MELKLKALAADPSQFQADICIPTGRGPRRFGDCMAPFQRERFAAVNSSLVAVSRNETPPVARVWDERTKGASKDTDWAVNLLWLLAFSRRPLRVQVGAFDQQQADEVRLIIRGMLRIDRPLNRFLVGLIDVQQTRIVNARTDSVCEILTTDRLGSHGARPDVVLLNELVHQPDRSFAETLLDNLDKMPCGFGVVATNAGFDPSWQLDWKRTFAEGGRWQVMECRETAPWIAPEALREAERRNTPGRFRRLWRGEWVSDTEGALLGADIDNCVTQTGGMNGDEKGWTFWGGLDIGVIKDASAFAVIGKHVGWCEEKPKPERQLTTTQKAMIDAGYWEEPEDETESVFHEGNGRLRLAELRSWKPTPGHRVSLEAVKAAIIMAHRQFNLAAVAVDPSQAEHLLELLERDGVPVIRTVQSTGSLQQQAVALLESFQERTIDLFPDADLLADLKRLQVKDSGMKIRLVSPESKSTETGTGHGDLASALSFAVALAKSRTFSFALRPDDALIVA
ncbi:MAG: hypothetical protein KKE86_07630 [Planctomycetes bacterium]|nr:hypothetical protein [Planctomycetota bacterium]MBU4399190.1 hypothetical protein [Planctomycetota bacterium]MCG2682893.1 hypothetical protein [Planctomycetales bacterium]